MLSIEDVPVIAVGSFLRSIFAGLAFSIAGIVRDKVVPILGLMMLVQCVAFLGCNRQLREISPNLVL